VSSILYRGPTACPQRPCEAAPPTGARALPRDEAVTLLYHRHYAALVSATVLLVGDVATAEDVVQDSFIAMHRAWWRLRDTSRALPYLRRSVMNRARSVLQHRGVVDRHGPGPAPGLPSAEEDGLAMLARSSVVTALGALPLRQRQVVVLRYYADLSETQIADALGIATGSVKTHATRALNSLRATAGQEWSGLPGGHGT
jgi:RNA polymerase sigma-70 factor (sigma-E family)